MIFAVISSIIIFLAVLSVLVLVHEFGHFLAARLFGVRVEEFGIGFPPRAFSVQKGDTLFTINWIPLGGFVKLKGEDKGDGGPDSFSSRPVWQRLSILAAGVCMNLLLTVAIFSAANIIGTPHVIADDAGTDGARNVHVLITQVIKDYPASRAGILPGDTLISLDGLPFDKVEPAREYIRRREGVALAVVIERNAERREYTITPEYLKESDRPALGVSLARVATVAYPAHRAVATAIQTTWHMAGALLKMLGTSLTSFAFDGFVGPVGIAQTTASATKLGFSYLMNLVAQLSLSLAIFNFLPIPALDGGRALFVLIEKIRGRSVRPHVEQMAHTIGFLVLIGLLLLITIQDIRRLLPT